MKPASSISCCALLFCLASAVPVEKRDVVWVTHTSVAIETVAVTQTVWIPLGANTVYHYADYHHQTTSSPLSTTTTSVAEVTSTSTSPLEESSIATPTSSPTPTTEPSTQHSAVPSTSSTTTTTTSTSTLSTPLYTPPIESSSSTSTLVDTPVTTSSSSILTSTTPAAYTPLPTTTTSSDTSTAPVSTVPAQTSAAAQLSGSSWSSGLVHSGLAEIGDITYYADGLGACGWTNDYNDAIVAISHTVYDASQVGANPNTNPLCGKMVNIVYNGQTFPAKVVDRCTGCQPGDLDLSEGFFSTVTNGDTAAGRISGVSWTWV